MSLLLAGSISTILAMIIALPAVILEIRSRGKVDELPVLVDVKTILGVKLKGMEVFWMGLLIHLVIGFLFGALYSWLMQTIDVRPWTQAYSALSLLIYTGLLWLVIGGGVFPLLKMGLFGRREGKWVWLELLIGMLLMALGFWLIIQWFWPAWFSTLPQL